MAASLVALSGPLRGETLALCEQGLTIGREPTNQLHPSDLSLSRRHCLFVVDGERVTIVDLDSLNGTFVNGSPIKERLLEHGDQLKIGESVFLFLDRDGASTDGGAAVALDDTTPRTTVRLRREDVLFLQSEQMLQAFAPTPRTARELHALLQISATLGSIRSSEQLQHALIDQLFDAMPADRAAILISDNDGVDFTSVVARGRTGAAPVQISRTVVRSVMTDNVALLCNEPIDTEAFRQSHSLAVTATTSVICAPLVVSARRRGALYVASSDRTVQFDEGHLQLLAAVAALAGVALLNVQHIERLERETRELRSDITLQHSMIGESHAMRQVCQLIGRVAPSDATVLLLGESGTGKELAARAIHVNSPRAHRPFVAITAAVLSDTLLESELFGHEKGAFTGAIAQKKGQLELADGGTVFLDEIGDLAMPLQIKLLRVLQEREFTRVGGTQPIKMDVRFIAATHRDLDAAVKDGRFREDLYYRLKVVALRLPALRDRRDDVPLLAAFFLGKFSTRCKRRVVGFSDEALECLVRYDWPGNVRELENAIERAVVLGSSERVLVDDLPENILDQRPDSAAVAQDYHRAVQAAKQQIVVEALRKARGNYANAARQLGLHPNNLRRLARSLDVIDPGKK
jgi:two-component system, NtrC family, response regulator HydG